MALIENNIQEMYVLSSEYYIITTKKEDVFHVSGFHCITAKHPLVQESREKKLALF